VTMIVGGKAKTP